LLTRFLTALPLIVGFILALYLASDTVWLGVMGLALFLAAQEWAGLSHVKGSAGYVYAALLTLLGLALVQTWQGLAWVYIPPVLFWLITPVLLFHGVKFSSRPVTLLLGALILVSSYLAIVELRRQDPGLLLALVGMVIIVDSAAYFTGRRFGRHKLAPMISPGKTWEGVAGAAVAVTVYAVVVWFLLLRPHMDGTLLQALLMAWFLLVLSVVGDLLESWLKRQAGVKDSGTLLPGHGGVLDRIDSLTAVLPATALYWIWLQ
jgi:phosphatidate cytidylyltransferase